jgi:hypothetical protein
MLSSDIIMRDEYFKDLFAHEWHLKPLKNIYKIEQNNFLIRKTISKKKHETAHFSQNKKKSCLLHHICSTNQHIRLCFASIFNGQNFNSMKIFS